MLSTGLARKEIDEDGEDDAADTPHPALVIPGIGRGSEAEEYRKHGLLGIFLAIGKGLVVDTGQPFKAFRADDLALAVFGRMDERVLFLKVAAAF